jgi:hypothetical protein
MIGSGRLQRLDGRAHPRRHQPARGCDEVDRHRRRPARRQHLLQLAARHLVAHHVVGQLAQAQAQLHGFEHTFGFVDAQARRGQQLDRGAALLQLPGPVAPGTGQAEGDHRMAGQLLHAPRRAVFGQVARARAQHQVLLVHAARHQRGVTQRADAHRQVDTFTHQVHMRVGQTQVKAQPRVLLAQCGQQRHHEALAVVHGCGHQQLARRRSLRARGLGAQVFHGGQHALAALVQTLAVGREPHLTRGAVEQLHAELRFQPRHGLGECRGCRALAPRGGREAAVFGGLGEGDESFQPGHAAPRPIEEELSSMLWHSALFSAGSAAGTVPPDATHPRWRNPPQPRTTPCT